MKVLVFCAHADDEVIAIGGTLRKLADSGAAIRMVMFSEGAEGYTRIEEKTSIVQRRHDETLRVCEILGIGEYFNLKQLDWDLKVNNAGYRVAIQHIREYQPDIIFTHSRADYNDHMVTHDTTTEAWLHAAIPCAMEDAPAWKLVPLYEYEVLQPLVNPGIIVDVTDTFSAKIEAMKCYGSQHDIVGGVFQMMEGRALERGYLIGVKYGEALARTDYRPRAVRNVSALLEE